MTRDSDFAARAQELARAGEAVARPKALYRTIYIEARGEDYVAADGIRLTSKLLATNLADSEKFYAYLATSGTEVADWAGKFTDLLDTYVADVIQDMARLTALNTLIGKIGDTYGLGNASSMNPGSLADWPIGEQKQLFALFGDSYRSIGVSLTSSMLMKPIKTISGICFATAHSFENCQLCPREKCPKRRAPNQQLQAEAGEKQQCG